MNTSFFLTYDIFIVIISNINTNIMMQSVMLVIAVCCWWMCVAKMSVSEQPCYTLINLPTDSEPPNEMQLKQDLGELW